MEGKNPFVNATKIYQFKIKDSEIKDYVQCYDCFQGMFKNNDNMTKTGLKGSVKFFPLILILMILIIFQISISI